MATQAQINQHELLIDSLTEDFVKEIDPLFVQFYDELASTETPTRPMLLQMFAELRRQINAQGAKLRQVLQSNLELNRSVLGENLDSETQTSLPNLEQEVLAQLNSSLDQEQNTIINTVMAAAIAGGITAVTIRELRSSREAIVKRMSTAFGTASRNFDGAVTLLRGRNSEKDLMYRYAGGVIAESRDFCRQLNGMILKESEIRDIWNNQEWQGKRPGDPFVVRGGYNCRHTFVPEEGEG